MSGAATERPWLAEFADALHAYGSTSYACGERGDDHANSDHAHVEARRAVLVLVKDRSDAHDGLVEAIKTAAKRIEDEAEAAFEDARQWNVEGETASERAAMSRCNKLNAIASPLRAGLAKAGVS